MSAETSDHLDQDGASDIPVYVRKAQEGLSSDYDGRLHSLTVQIRTATAAEAAALYEAYLADLAKRKEQATGRILERTPARLDLNRFEIGLIEAQERQIAKYMASPAAQTMDLDKVKQILELKKQPPEVAPLFAAGEEPEDLQVSLLGIGVEHHDGKSPPQTAFTFKGKGKRRRHSPQNPSLAEEVSSVPPSSFVGPHAPYSAFTIDGQVEAMEGELIPAVPSSGKTSLSPVVPSPQQGVGIEDIRIEHIDMEPTHHGKGEHDEEMKTNGTHRWTPQRIAEDEARVGNALARLTGQNLQTFLVQVLVPLRKEVLTELGRRKEDELSFSRSPSLASDNALFSHADRLRDFVKAAQTTLRNSPPAPTSALDDGGSSPPPPPPTSGSSEETSGRLPARTDSLANIAAFLATGNRALEDAVELEQGGSLSGFAAEGSSFDTLRKAAITELIKRRSEQLAADFAWKNKHLMNYIDDLDAIAKATAAGNVSEIASPRVSASSFDRWSPEGMNRAYYDALHDYYEASRDGISRWSIIRDDVDVDPISGESARAPLCKDPLGTQIQDIQSEITHRKATSSLADADFRKQNILLLDHAERMERLHQVVVQKTEEEERAYALEKLAAQQEYEEKSAQTAPKPSLSTMASDLFSRTKKSLTETFGSAVTTVKDFLSSALPLASRFSAAALVAVGLGGTGSLPKPLPQQESIASTASAPAEISLEVAKAGREFRGEISQKRSETAEAPPKPNLG